MLIVDVDGLHVLQASQLPLAARVHKHRPDGDVVVAQASVVVEERQRALKSTENGKLVNLDGASTELEIMRNNLKCFN